MTITIAGCGPGSPELITPAARSAARSAKLLIGSPRLLACFPESSAERLACSSDTRAVLEALERGPRPACVLVSGDPGLCSLARPVRERFGRACRVLPGVSAVQAAFAAADADWLGCLVLSSHARRPPMMSEDLLRAAPSIAVLCGDADSLAWIAELHARLGDCRRLVVCDNLTLAKESVRSVARSELSALSPCSLRIVLLLKELHA